MNKDKEIKKTETIINKKSDMKRRAAIINIESPIMVRLEIEKVPHKLIAKLVFANVSDEDVIIDENKLGGDKLRFQIFNLNPWYTSPNLTFIPYDSQKVSPKYIVMKPHQVIETQTELNQYYNFDERKYDTLSVGYLNLVNCLDKNYQPIRKKDIDGIEKAVIFAIESNDIDLDYNKDIKPILR